MRNSLLFLTVLFLLSGIILAEELKAISGKELLNKISSSNDGDKSYALGYITGVFCVYTGTYIPDDQTMKEVVRIVKEYLEKNPKKLNQPAVKLLMRAFEKKYPLKELYLEPCLQDYFLKLTYISRALTYSENAFFPL